MKPTNECIPVAHEWMGLGFDPGLAFEVHVNCLRVTDPGPHFFYKQHGRTHVSREPLAYVKIDASDGLWRGAVRWSDLRSAGVAMAWRHLEPPHTTPENAPQRHLAGVT